MTDTKQYDYIINRDFEPDIAFNGEEIANESNWEPNGPNQNRFNTATMYKTTGEQYILHTEYKSQWQGESCESNASIHDTLDDAIEAFKTRFYQDISHIDNQAINHTGLARWEKDFIKSCGRQELQIVD